MFLVSALCSVVQSPIVKIAPFFISVHRYGPSPLLSCRSNGSTPSGVGVVVPAGTGGRGWGQVRRLVATGLPQPLRPRLTEVLTQLKQVQGLKLEK